MHQKSLAIKMTHILRFPSHCWRIWSIIPPPIHWYLCFRIIKDLLCFVYFMRVGAKLTSGKVNKSGCAPKGSWWHRNSSTFIRLIRQCMGLLTSQLCQFRPRSILWGFVVPKSILLFTTKGWSAQPYTINFGGESSFHPQATSSYPESLLGPQRYSHLSL